MLKWASYASDVQGQSKGLKVRCKSACSFSNDFNATGGKEGKV